MERRSPEDGRTEEKEKGRNGGDGAPPSRVRKEAEKGRAVV